MNYEKHGTDVETEAADAMRERDEAAQKETVSHALDEAFGLLKSASASVRSLYTIGLGVTVQQGAVDAIERAIVLVETSRADADRAGRRIAALEELVKGQLAPRRRK